MAQKIEGPRTFLDRCKEKNDGLSSPFIFVSLETWCYNEHWTARDVFVHTRFRIAIARGDNYNNDDTHSYIVVVIYLFCAVNCPRTKYLSIIIRRTHKWYDYNIFIYFLYELNTLNSKLDTRITTYTDIRTFFLYVNTTLLYRRYLNWLY